jgi:two-component system nitrate/nitrite response regulator NarL
MHDVVLIDDHPLFRQGMKDLLDTVSGQLRVVGEADNGIDGIAQVRRLKPQVVLLDLHMKGGLDGLDVLRELKAADGAPVTIMVTVSEDAEDLTAALRAGADGYLLKDMAPQELLASVLRTAETGAMALSASLASLLANAMREDARPRNRDAAALTPQENRVLDQIRAGRSNKQIARELGIAESTVKIHVKRVLKKINVSSRTQAAIWALSHG